MSLSVQIRSLFNWKTISPSSLGPWKSNDRTAWETECNQGRCCPVFNSVRVNFRSLAVKLIPSFLIWKCFLVHCYRIAVVPFFTRVWAGWWHCFSGQGDKFSQAVFIHVPLLLAEMLNKPSKGPHQFIGNRDCAGHVGIDPGFLVCNVRQNNRSLRFLLKKK